MRKVQPSTVYLRPGAQGGGLRVLSSVTRLARETTISGGHRQMRGISSVGIDCLTDLTTMVVFRSFLSLGVCVMAQTIFATAVCGADVLIRRESGPSDAQYWRDLNRRLEDYKRRRPKSPALDLQGDDGVTVYADAEMPDLGAELETDLPDEYSQATRKWRRADLSRLAVDCTGIPSDLAAAGFYDLAPEAAQCGHDTQATHHYSRYWFDKQFRVLRPFYRSSSFPLPYRAVASRTTFDLDPVGAPIPDAPSNRPLPRKRIQERGADWLIPGALQRDMRAESLPDVTVSEAIARRALERMTELRSVDADIRVDFWRETERAAMLAAFSKIVDRMRAQWEATCGS